jgi:mono/diheme cytochrome c family protein
VIGVSSAEELNAAITEGQGSMPGFAEELSAEQIAELVSFVQALGDLTSGPPTEGGVEIFIEQCSACHGRDGRGGVGPSLRTTLLEGADLRGAIEEGNATMPAFATTLESRDLDLVVSYVEGLRTTGESAGADLQGGPAIYQQDCSACHGEQGEGGIGPELRGTSLSANDIIAQVYGGHTAGMPAFEGALNSEQVRDVALFIRSMEAADDGGSGWRWLPAAGLAVGLLAVTGVVVMAVVRLRRRQA